MYQIKTQKHKTLCTNSIFTLFSSKKKAKDKQTNRHHYSGTHADTDNDDDIFQFYIQLQ